MIATNRDSNPTWFKQPESLTKITIDPRTGKRLQASHQQPVHVSTELCSQDSLPIFWSKSDYSPDGLALLDQSYSEWLASDQNHRRDEVTLAPFKPSSAALRILAPRPDATYILDPELPNGGRLHLATNLPGLAEWKCDTLTLRPSDADPTAILSPGVHTLIATDPRNGESIPITLTVKSR